MHESFALSSPGSLLALALSLAMTGCFTRQGDEAAFRYHAASGKCLDAAGEEGLNPYDSAAVHGSKRAECVNLSYQDLILLEKGVVTSANDTLKDWDFRGTIHYGSRLHSNHITGADYRGANLHGLIFDHSVIEGKADGFTEFPEEFCTLKGAALRCVRE
jgi:hypothetical protein